MQRAIHVIATGASSFSLSQLDVLSAACFNWSEKMVKADMDQASQNYNEWVLHSVATGTGGIHA
eukprot:4406487-Pyramimonas_sp.AAC.1